jgi:hypothetical protein
MANTGFTRKKVESMTLGEKLKKIRSEYRISLNEVSKHTKIRAEYLEYLESGEYEKLPADVYVRGFVRSYAHFLEADERVLVKMYERESDIQRHIRKDQFHDQSQNAFDFPRFVITPKVFVAGGVLALLFGVSWYLYREFRAFASEPRLTVEEPFDGQAVFGNEVTVRGNTDSGATLSINDQSVLVRDGGVFFERVPVHFGVNALTVVSTNKFKKEKRVTISVEGIPVSGTE